MSNGKLPVATGRDVVRALERAGFAIDRVVGSHHVMAHPSNPKRTVSVAVHGNRDLKRGTLRAIIRQSGLSVEEFDEFL
jgi:predicted RNA binding protein YcfA (HicA-like mRNA interferase family)